MSCIQGLLSQFCIEVERELKPKIESMWTGWAVKGYLPQNWIFKVDNEIITFSIDKDGNANVRAGTVSNPDVVITWEHDLLAHVLKTRNKQGIPPGEVPRVETLTPKGRTAFNTLRKRIGI